MKNTIILSAALLISVVTFAGNITPAEKGSSNSFVDKTSITVEVNESMIQKFNNSDYPSNTVTFQQLVDNYSVEELKKFSKAYFNNNMNQINSKEFSNVIEKHNAESEINKLISESVIKK